MRSDGRNSVERFDDRTDDYVRYRPTYPVEAIHAVVNGLGPAAQLHVADIGAGTGISARLLAGQGVHVVAIEPGEAMRRAAAPHPRVRWIAGRAEAIGLRSRVVDIVVCAQSFHWFDPAAVLPEFARILKADGRLALIWNRRSRSDRLTAAYREAILEVTTDTGAESGVFERDFLPASGLFSSPERLTFPNVQRLDLEGLIGRARSASYVPKSGPDSERLIASLGALHARHADADGLVNLIYETEVFRARKLGQDDDRDHPDRRPARGPMDNDD